MNKCVNHQAQSECTVLLSLSNCASVHAPCTDVNSDIVAHISLALLIGSTVRRCIMKVYCIIYAVVVASYISVLCTVAAFAMWCMASFVHYSHDHDLLPYLTAAFTVSLELQGHCSDQLTLMCRHSDIGTPPLWIHNGTLQTHVQSLATNRQQCVPKLCMWFSVHVFMSA